MNKRDVIFAVICGLAVAWVVLDFALPFARAFFVILPVLSVAGLLLCDILGKKLLFVRQAGRFVLVGVFADVVDIKVFQLLFWLVPFSLFFKIVSFLIAVVIKYAINKYWTFEKTGEGASREAVQFFAVTIVGLLLNVASFYCATKIIGPQFALSTTLWTELSIIFAALVAAIWNFLGYKFLVFKK